MEGIVTLTLGGRRGTKATMSTLGNQVDWEDQPAATCDSRRSIRSWKSKTAAFRREFELILLPVGSLSASLPRTCHRKLMFPAFLPLRTKRPDR
jgi:hypothetical protein